MTEGTSWCLPVKGELTAKGPTDQRPNSGCARFTPAMRIPLFGRTLIWTGKEWR